MHFIGIDIGGTTIKAGLVTASGAIVDTRSVPTETNNLDQLVSELEHLTGELQRNHTVSRVGLGIPGLRHAQTGVMKTSPNIPCIRNVNLEVLLAERSGLQVTSENDAKAGAYGEFVCGAGQGCNSLAYITLGTGMGCGLVLGGQLYRGSSGYAGELGHVTVEANGRHCACGAVGCLETRVSAAGIVATARELATQTSGTMLTATPHPWSAETIYEAARQGDPVAKSAFAETGRFLGIACTALINLLNPERIVIGGGVMASGNLLLEPARNEVERRAFAPSAQDCPIVQSQLWPDSGIIGAAMLARDR